MKKYRLYALLVAVSMFCLFLIGNNAPGETNHLSILPNIFILIPFALILLGYLLFELPTEKIIEIDSNVYEIKALIREVSVIFSVLVYAYSLYFFEEGSMLIALFSGTMAFVITKLIGNFFYYIEKKIVVIGYNWYQKGLIE